ncbi:3-deoxy-D-manno-octulosonic acid transferase [Rhodobacteraceae bacterium DSL-40]|uniref:3-deoxy-D-manno-octulosonic acid transferase n=1 Tax=Amaricoccus sp. B4 TaxID=3368557 RepID=UPI000DAB46D5
MPAAPRRTLMLWFYLLVSRRLGWFARRRLVRRCAAGKEDPNRLGERMGQAGLDRPEGPLVWFHAASVGEAMSLIELLRRLRQSRPELTCLVTSGTLTSARMLAARLPPGCLHQFVPLDVLPWVQRFLDHWRPELAVWTESELWPATLCEVSRRGIPMMLINARISARTYRRWKSAPRTARALLRRFDRILAQDDLAGMQLAALGADPDRLSVSGSLKEGAAPLPHDEAERRRMTSLLGGRPVWVAASTHGGEEELVLAAHAAAVRAIPRLLLILVPRHPERGDEIEELLRSRKLRSARRSADEPLTEDTDAYLADTLGELGIWYRIAPVSFVGGSLKEIGGHNPYEPALLGSAILHGPHVRNFADAYRKLTEAGAAMEVHSAADFGRALVLALAPDTAARMAAAGWDVVSESAEVTDRVLAEIELRLGREPA